MKYLLDTHIFLWRLLEPGRLSRAQAAALADIESELYLSPISIWEALVWARKGRLRLAPDPERFLRIALADSPTRMAPVTFEIAFASERLEGFRNPDPADRLLVATSLVEDLCLITADDRIRRWQGVTTLP